MIKASMSNMDPLEYPQSPIEESPKECPQCPRANFAEYGPAAEIKSMTMPLCTSHMLVLFPKLKPLYCSPIFALVDNNPVLLN